MIASFSPFVFACLLCSSLTDGMVFGPRKMSSRLMMKDSAMSIPKTMKAAVVTEHKGAFSISDLPMPIPGKGQALMKIIASGVCHTDVHAVDGDWPVKSILPLIPGHEGAGVVVQVGEGVENLKVGDRVGMAWLHSACGECEFCTSGWESLCPHQHNTGYSVSGTYGEYVVGQASHLVKIPDNVSFQQAAPLLCAGVTSYKGLKETEVKPGEFVTIVGAAGGLGHLAIQYANAMGMRVIAIDVGQDKIDYCKSIGAEFAFDATSPDTVDKVTSVTSGGSHGVLCLATSTSSFLSSVKMSRRKGTVVCVGLPPGSFDTPIFEVVLKRITIRGSIVGTRKDLQETLDFAARGLVKCTVEMESMDNINNVFDRLRSGQVTGRIVLDVGNECNCHAK